MRKKHEDFRPSEEIFQIIILANYSRININNANKIYNKINDIKKTGERIKSPLGEVWNRRRNFGVTTKSRIVWCVF